MEEPIKGFNSFLIWIISILLFLVVITFCLKVIDTNHEERITAGEIDPVKVTELKY